MSKHPLRERPNRLLRITTSAAVVAAAAIAGVAGTPAAHADNANDAQGRAWICHPVHGAGELNDGWNLIDPADPSVHIDEAAYLAGDAVYGKHQVTDADGTVRSDVYATVDPGVDPQHATAAQVSCPGDQPPLVERLAVAQSISTSYDRHYDWTLAKTSDRTDSWLYSPHATGAHSDTIGWTVTATATKVDDGYTVDGTVAVTNPGDNDTSFTLTLSPAIATVDCGQGTGATATIAKGAEVDCTWSTTGQPTGPVTATATTDVNSYGSAATPITWGAPASVVDKTATLADASQGYSATVDADDSPVVKTFSTTVGWADRACGTSTLTNTATLSTVALPASASVSVHRQCETFAADTAWAAAGAAGTNKYNSKGGGNWATYVPGPSGTYNLYAGQTKAAGTVTVTPGGAVTVDLANGFAFASGTGTLHIQGYASPPSGNPAPGQFQYHFDCSGTTCSPGTIKTAKYYGIQLEIGRWTPDPTFGP
ncbi:MAG: hypothetical protein FWE71_14390 [Nocardioidaceae bacterium]|nr:hypothetical protein [Nocardioidaceae bacterium]MCL2614116.1 hypothetical protein [Nocardioidaceae bacterium]